jgi:hypothetical protein
MRDNWTIKWIGVILFLLGYILVVLLLSGILEVRVDTVVDRRDINDVQLMRQCYEDAHKIVGGKRFYADHEIAAGIMATELFRYRTGR